MAALPLVLKHKSQRGMRSVRSSTLLGEGPQKGILDYGGSGSVVWAPGTAFVHARAPVRVLVWARHSRLGLRLLCRCVRCS